MTPSSATFVLAGGAMLGVGVPWVTVRLLAPALAEGRVVENYRGRRVFHGLGVAWLVWAGAAIVMGVAGSSVAGEVSILPLLTLAGPLALVCFALGLVDDSLGTAASRGFRGHLSALRRGRLTTGGLKLLGISAASLVAGLVLAQAAGLSEESFVEQLGYALVAGASIALTANFVNLTDLRPARALKVYSLLAVVGVASCVLGLSAVVDAPWEVRAVDGLVLLAFALGPVAATWHYDAGELGMLGDAGANPAGAVAGLLVVAGLPLAAIVAYFAVMLVVNLASERHSFSSLIERNAVLKRLDMLGRQGESVMEHGSDRPNGNQPRVESSRDNATNKET